MKGSHLNENSYLSCAQGSVASNFATSYEISYCIDLKPWLQQPYPQVEKSFYYYCVFLRGQVTIILKIYIFGKSTFPGEFF